MIWLSIGISICVHYGVAANFFEIACKVFAVRGSLYSEGEVMAVSYQEFGNAD
jgi:hypothetical protein